MGNRLQKAGLSLAEAGYIIVTESFDLARAIMRSLKGSQDFVSETGTGFWFKANKPGEINRKRPFTTICHEPELFCWVCYTRRGAITVIFTSNLEETIGELVKIREGKTQTIILVGIAPRNELKDSLLVAQASTRITSASVFPAIADIDVTCALRSAAMHRPLRSRCDIVSDASCELLFHLAREKGFRASGLLLLSETWEHVPELTEVVLQAISVLQS